MKKASILLLSALLMMVAHAQTGVFTLLHNGQASFFYQPNTTLIDIITNHAQAGDTIVFPGGEVAIPNNTITLNKPLTFIGAGIDPAASSVTNITTLSNGIYQNPGFVINSDGSGSKFEGIRFNRTLKFGQNVSNVSFSRCEFTTGLMMVGIGYNLPIGLTLSQCVLNGITFSSTSSSQVIMTNCILSGTLNMGSGFLNGTADQCIFINASLTSNQGFIFTNCAFISNSTSGMVMDNLSTYDHCLFAPTNGTVTFGSQTVHMGDMITTFNAGNLFVNATANGFDYNFDYRPAPGSALLGSGVDGQNIGVYGPGTTGWKPYAIPSNPHWSQFTPNGNMITNGGTIQVHIKAEAQQN